MNRMKELFKTKVKEDPRKRKQSEDEERESKRLRREEEEVTYVGRATPAEDFRYLLAHSVTSGTNLTVLSQQLETVLLNLLASPFSSSLTTKIISSLSALREESVANQRPELYNRLVKKLKADMIKQGKARLWLEVVEANLGLIANSEVAGGAEEEEADSFLLPPDSVQEDEDN